MPTQSYRFYRLDCAGHLHEAAWFVADSDEDAIEQNSNETPRFKVRSVARQTLSRQHFA